jgi:hypothetical protein
MKDNNPPEEVPKMRFKISVVAANGPAQALRIGSTRIVFATYNHGYVFWADGYPVAFLVDEDRAHPARKNRLEFAKYCPADVAAEIGAYVWNRFPEVFPTEAVEAGQAELFLIVQDIPQILMRITQG